MIELGPFVAVFEFIRKWIFPNKTKFGSFQEFLDKKLKQAEKLSRKRSLAATEVIAWHDSLLRGLRIALGSPMKSRDIELTLNILNPKVDALKFYGNSQTSAALEQLLNECAGHIIMIRKDVLPDMLSPHFEPDDLKA